MTFKEYIIEREVPYMGSIIIGESLICVEDAVEYHNGYLEMYKPYPTTLHSCKCDGCKTRFK